MNFPFLATLLLLIGLAGLIGALALATWRYRARATIDDAQLPEGFGPRVTSRRLRYVRWAFALLVLAALGFHFYWGLWATGPLGENEAFAALKNRRDQRNRRELESTLRGWIYDRHHDSRRALAKYRYLNGRLTRDHPLGAGAAHLIGYSTFVRGDAMLERAVAAASRAQEPQGFWQNLTALNNEDQLPPVGKDLTLTIDFDLQQAAAEQLRGKRGAIVLFQPQTGEILALASAPSFDPADIDNEETWPKILNDARNQPLLNRALAEYYLPGSTFKTVTAAAALDGRMYDRKFNCKSEGWMPPGSGRPIRDDNGEAHGTIDLNEAYVHSCNQYFAQLGAEVERLRMGEAAARFGLRTFETGAASIGPGFDARAWNTDNPILSAVLSPLVSTFVNGRRISKYDLGLESIGQGYVQLTVFQMALVAAAAANLRGEVMRPMIEFGRQPVAGSQAMTPETAVKLRTMMRGVVERGTARRFGAMIAARGITAGGKTGTAQREVPMVDPNTGKRLTYTVNGRTRFRMERDKQIDSWFIGFAPFERPMLAWAVMVEGGGYGAETAAPIAGELVARAKTLGLLGGVASDAAAKPDRATGQDSDAATRRRRGDRVKPGR